jgi:site-specific DNA-cytosine methylase
MKVLIACEESQSVCVEFRKKGHKAYSCDLLECSGGYPKWHIKDDVFNVINDNWDILIAFPPCTHLAVSGSQWFEQKIKDGRQSEGINFFMKIINAPINKIAVENPIGIMSKKYRKPDQIIQPYYFGDPYQKSTCLWLKNLPKLFHSNKIDLFNNHITHVEKGDFFEWIDKKSGKTKRQPLWYKMARSLPTQERQKIRSKTFPGIAKAMANQWG